VPPAFGLETLIGKLPGAATSDAGIVTIIRFGVMLLGFNAAVPKLTLAPDAKFVPEITIAKVPVPAAIDVADKLAIAGLLPGTYSATTKDSSWETPPPGCPVCTRTRYVPAHAMVTLATNSCGPTMLPVVGTKPD